MDHSAGETKAVESLPMDTKQKDFVDARAAAHKAACQNIAQDPLVKIALETQRERPEIMARWKEGSYRMTHKAEQRLTRRRQAE